MWEPHCKLGESQSRPEGCRIGQKPGLPQGPYPWVGPQRGHSSSLGSRMWDRSQPEAHCYKYLYSVPRRPRSQGRRMIPSTPELHEALMESQQAGEGADPKAKRCWEQRRGRGASTPQGLQQLCPCPSGLWMPHSKSCTERDLQSVQRVKSSGLSRATQEKLRLSRAGFSQR